MGLDKFVAGMGLLRLLSGCVEIAAAIIMLRLNQVDKALAVNAGLALVGPMVLVITTTIGLIGMADKLSWDKLLWICCGVACLIFGVLKK
ncbi:YqhV family protein [Paenibacillus sp. P96]|uniref:YqhV family protein n=1 Tax=Paenibacillus zeirhizosphaerae TaxID=2987519 RepID=A0ABT9FPU0_9BACL|nr:YqhV family protein [Paenibacillus sp. P96]MDP4096751.1 YqhV family protein [Paenibacillus sp. P96]